MAISCVFKMFRLSCFVLLLFYSNVFGDRVGYEGHKVYRVHHGDQLDILIEMENQKLLDFFGNPSNDISDVLVSPGRQREFLEILENRKIISETLIEDVQDVISQQPTARSEARGNMSWDVYYDLDGIYDWLDSLPPDFPSIVSVISAGKSYEGRNIKGVKLSFASGKRSVFIEGGIHGREWIAPATVTYIINELLTSNDTQIRKIARSFDWYIYPVVNPDGYVYTYTTDRLWRKNRTPYGICSGADMNRNWDFYWGQLGASNNTCSLTYAGPRVFSEVEVVALRDTISSLASNIDVYFAFHSYSQLFLVPFANTTDQLLNYNDTVAIGKKAIEATRVKYGTNYTVGNSAEILYYSSGTSRDWVKDKFNVTIVYTVELRDTGTYGFLLPPEQILPNNEEIVDGLVTIFLEAERLGYFVLG